MKQKKLNFFDIFSMGIGSSIGSGIFVLVGYGIASTGRSVMLALILGCIMMFFAYISQIFMVSMFPLKGGTYSQNALLLPPILTGISAIFMLVISTSLAVYASGIVSYLVSLFPGVEPFGKVISVLIITFFFAITIRGSKVVGMVQDAMTVVLLCALVLFIIIGLPHVNFSTFFSATEDGGFFHGGFAGLITAVSLMSYTCQGTTGGIALTAATENPTRTIPLAIMADTVAIGVIYALVGIVAAGVLPYDTVAGANLTATAQAIFPTPLFYLFIVCGAMFALATSLLGAIAALRYPIQQVAEDGWLPKFFTKKTAHGYPWVTQLTFYLIAIIPIVFGVSFDSLVALVQAPTMVLGIFGNVLVMGIPKKYPEQWKKSVFHMPLPLFYIMMGLGVVVNIVVAYNLFVTLTPGQMVADVIALVACIVLAYVRIKTKAVDMDKLLAVKDAAVAEVEAYVDENTIL